MAQRMYVMSILAVLILFTVPVMAGTVVYASDISVNGLFGSSTNVVTSTCNSTDSISNGMFAMANINDRQVLQGTQYTRSVTNTAGIAVVSDSMSSMAYQKPSQSCGNGKSCEVTPGFYTATQAQSTAIMYGSGTINVVSAPATFGVSANGAGMYSFNAGVIDMQQKVGSDGKLSSCVDMTEFSQRTQVIGKYGVTQYFTHK